MKPYIPDKLPLENINWAQHIPAIGRANTAIGRYDGILQSIVNPYLLLSPLTTNEAVISSQIEGSQAALEDVLEYDADPTEILEDRKHADIMEVINYRNAIAYATDKLNTHPLSLNLIKEIHAILLDSVRGQNKNPGEFRRVQNYIGAPGAGIEQAAFIPPSPELIMPYLDNWEKYIHSDEKDVLIQLAIAKAQFEIIHPFLDGNGRIGRLLIPLFLYEKKALSSPMFYLSAYLESNREVYYQKLRAVSETKDWDGWIAFFLHAVIEQAKINIFQANKIQALYEKMKIQIPEITNSKFAISATDALFAAPILTTASFIEKSGIPKASAVRIINKLKEDGILIGIRKSSGRRAAMFLFEELFEIIK
jgi:Fic family protein